MKFNDWMHLKENSRYSVEVNYKTNLKEVLDGFSKISLVYVSAALKQNGYHVKRVFEEYPFRVLVSSRNWDDGEWVGMVSFDKNSQCFIISRGFYNKDKRTISIQRSEKCKYETPAEVAKELKSLMEDLKGQKDRHLEKLKGVKLKTGPKK